MPGSRPSAPVSTSNSWPSSSGRIWLTKKSEMNADVPVSTRACRPGVIPMPRNLASIMPSARFVSPPCSTITPFGRPVEPDVNIMYARSCGPTRRQRDVGRGTRGVRRHGRQRAGQRRGVLRHDDRRLRVVQHHPEPGRRQVRVQRQEGAAGLPHRPHGHDRVDTGPQVQADHVTTPHTGRDQPPRQRIAAGTESANVSRSPPDRTATASGQEASRSRSNSCTGAKDTGTSGPCHEASNRCSPAPSRGEPRWCARPSRTMARSARRWLSRSRVTWSAVSFGGRSRSPAAFRPSRVRG